MCASSVSESVADTVSVHPHHPTCTCGSPVALDARRCGLNCQRLFEHAFVREGHEELYARAVFTCFCVQGQPATLVPSAVRAFLEQYGKKGVFRDHNPRAFCVGCMLDPRKREGLAFVYMNAHPEVTLEHLVSLAK